MYVCMYIYIIYIYIYIYIFVKTISARYKIPQLFTLIPPLPPFPLSLSLSLSLFSLSLSLSLSLGQLSGFIIISCFLLYLFLLFFFLLLLLLLFFGRPINNYILDRTIRIKCSKHCLPHGILHGEALYM